MINKKWYQVCIGFSLTTNRYFYSFDVDPFCRTWDWHCRFGEMDSESEMLNGCYSYCFGPLHLEIFNNT